jgi:hypothetical protein
MPSCKDTNDVLALFQRTSGPVTQRKPGAHAYPVGGMLGVVLQDILQVVHPSSKAVAEFLQTKVWRCQALLGTGKTLPR